jgi:hypothetical protein
LLQLRFGPFDGTPVQCGGGQREGPVKVSHHIRAKFFDQSVQVFVRCFQGGEGQPSMRRLSLSTGNFLGADPFCSFASI